MDLDKILKPGSKIYFVGIGGIAMSACANIATYFGYEVLGSDSKEIYAPSKDVLESNKINFSIGYDEKNIKSSGADLFVISAGEDLSNPEVKYIYDTDLPHVGLAEFLGFLSQENLRVVVTGTHGKSTTAAALGYVLKSLDDSSFMAGAVLQNFGQNFHCGDGHYFVFEGDEYKEEFDNPTPKFHFYKPDIIVLTNLEYDHPDLFESFEMLENEFRHLIENLPEDGLIVYNADDEHLPKLVHESNISSVSFGIENEADFKVEQIQYGEQYTTFEVQNKFSKNVSSKLLGLTEQYKIQLPGKINVYNALAVVATLRALGFAQEQIALDLLSFSGTKRRFELIGVKNGVTLIDDYAHHPTAVRETLEAARLRFFPSPSGRGIKGEGSKLWAIFEPHTFSRTKATLADLAKSFDAADEVLISKIYPAREKISEATIKSEEVVEEIKSAIQNPQSKIRLVNNKQEALEILKNEVKAGDVVIVMAVGDFNHLPYELKEIL